MSWTKLLLGCGLLAVSGLLVYAQTADTLRKGRKGRADELAARFEKLDRNGDDRLAGERLFNFLNSDSDQAVTLEEARRVIRERGLEALQAAMGSPSEGDRVTATKPTAEAAVPPRPQGSDQAGLQEGPRRLIAGDHGIGKQAPDLTFKTLTGREFRLSELATSQGVVLAWTNTTCPVCKKYTPTLAAIEDEYKDRGITFVFVNPTNSDSLEAIQQTIQQQGLDGAYVRDPDGEIARAVGAMQTTDTILLDARRTIIYRGAVDDQYGFGYSTAAPKRNFLRDAIEGLLSNELPLVQATSAPGCPLSLSPLAPPSTAVTYHNRISRIMQYRCLECHRDGGVAPFALASYLDVTSQSGAIRQVLERGVMPPWFAASQDDELASPFANDCSLSKSEKQDLFAWLDGGMPEGLTSDSPLPRIFDSDWQIGKPDHIVQLPQPLAVKATGTMPYQHVTVDAGLSETKYVQAIEVRPTAREVVHHILVFVVPPAGKNKDSREEDFDETSGFFAAYAPGYDALVFNRGYGKVLPAGSRLRFQIHYTPNGTATQDQPMIGMRFADGEPEHLVDVHGIAQIRLAIPPHASHHQVVATQVLPQDTTLLAFFPHMHLRGKAFKYEALLPSGETQLLLDIPRYDFNWQLSYRLADPVHLPKGTTLRATAWYDNSAGNLANPDPNRTVRWGPQTTDEMMIGYVEYHMEDGSLGRGGRLAEFRERFTGIFNLQQAFRKLDSDGDGRLSESELPAGQRSQLRKLDRNQDGFVDLEETKDLRKLFNSSR
jgi:peroxiredoxin